MSPLIDRGYLQPLEESDMYPNAAEDDVKVVKAIFESEWIERSRKMREAGTVTSDSPYAAPLKGTIFGHVFWKYVFGVT